MAEPAPATMPKNAIVILLDSLNRHMLGAYGGQEFQTPNLDAFAARNRCATCFKRARLTDLERPRMAY